MHNGPLPFGLPVLSHCSGSEARLIERAIEKQGQRPREPWGQRLDDSVGAKVYVSP